MTDAPDRPSDRMADADVANGESGVLDEGFEEQQGQRPPPVDPAQDDDTDTDTDIDIDDDHA